MTTAYRDDEAPLRERIEGLEREREALRDRARELHEMAAREAEIAREIEETRERLEALRGPAMDLEHLRIASPCKASWDDMIGDDRVRFCGTCQKNVFNLSEMRRDEARALVREREGDLCVRMYRRADGTVLTADCPVGARRAKVRRLTVLAVGGGALALAGAGLHVARPMQGEVAPPPRPPTVVDVPQVDVPSEGDFWEEPPAQILQGLPARPRFEKPLEPPRKADPRDKPATAPRAKPTGTP